MTATTENPAILHPEPTPGAVTGHWSLTDNPHLLRAFEFAFEVDEGRLDPQGAWEQRFDVVFCGPQNFTEPHWVYQGWIDIFRKPEPDDTVSLRMVDGHILGPREDLEWQLIEQAAIHNRDALATIPDNTEWTVHSRTLGQPDPAARPFAESRESSVLRPGDGQRFRERTIGGLQPVRQPLPAGMPVTTSLGLIEACHRMGPGDADAGLEFGIFKDGTAWCPGQRLKALPESSLTVNGRHFILHGFVQTGTAHLPTFLWFDGNGHMVALRKGVLALVANSSPVMKARCPHAA